MQRQLVLSHGVSGWPCWALNPSSSTLATRVQLHVIAVLRLLAPTQSDDGVDWCACEAAHSSLLHHHHLEAKSVYVPHVLPPAIFSCACILICAACRLRTLASYPELTFIRGMMMLMTIYTYMMTCGSCDRLWTCWLACKVLSGCCGCLARCWMESSPYIKDIPCCTGDGYTCTASSPDDLMSGCCCWAAPL